MAYMFAGCAKLDAVDFASLATGNVNDMQYMFSGCARMTSFYVPNFNVTRVSNMTAMFQGCTLATAVVANHWELNLGGSVNTTNMFSGDSQLVTIFVGDGWDATRLGASTGMFAGCVKLVGGDGTAFNATAPGINGSAATTAGGYMTYADYVVTYRYIDYASANPQPTYMGYAAGEVAACPYPPVWASSSSTGTPRPTCRTTPRPFPTPQPTSTRPPQT